MYHKYVSSLATPAELDALRKVKKKGEESERDLAAHSLAERILDEALKVGNDRVYLYNPFLANGKQLYPEVLVRKAVRLLNESGHWRARAVYVRWWHPLLFMNLNHRVHHGTPVWRIHLKPTVCHSTKQV